MDASQKAYIDISYMALTASAYLSFKAKPSTMPISELGMLNLTKTE